MRADERLIRYAAFSTAADEASSVCPSTPGQKVLGAALVQELITLGLADAAMDENGYVIAHLPASPGAENAPVLGLLAHIDTSPDAPGEGVRVVVHENYDGGALALGDSGLSLTAERFPHLPALLGKTLLTTDGTTLLGADDKAGIAEIMTVLERVITQKLPHPPLAIGFTPDEEIGRGPDRLDLERFGAKYAYTVDGGELPVIEGETFNAASARVHFRGLSVHPGYAKGVMKNAAQLAAQFAAALPADETPAATAGREGFFHLCRLSGAVEQAEADYIIRDHDRAKFEARKNELRKLAEQINEAHGAGTVRLTITDSYYNMGECFARCPFLIEDALSAARELGFAARTEPIRGGTDGSRLSFMGLPCPNLPTGGYAFHGPFEHIAAEDMESCCKLILRILEKAILWS